MKLKLLFSCLGLITTHFLIGQHFVNPTNKWFIDDCCVNFNNGEIDCYTSEVHFGEIVFIDNLEYRELLNDNASSSLFSHYGKYYRESDGKVYVKQSESANEYLIYDFNVMVGDQLTLGESNSSQFLVDIVSIDSITLNSGEKRKTIEIAYADNPFQTALWIEGIGSSLSPMNTQYMFTFDCWNELNCFFINEEEEHVVGDCELTGINDFESNQRSFSIFPNPTNQQLFIDTKGYEIESLTILDYSGKTLSTPLRINKEVDVGTLTNGFYIITIRFQDGKVGHSKFFKI